MVGKSLRVAHQAQSTAVRVARLQGLQPVAPRALPVVRAAQAEPLEVLLARPEVVERAALE